MIRFILKRFAYGFLVILGVIVIVFFLFHALPGDPAAMMAGQRTDVSTLENIREELGLDKPLMSQLGFYMNDLSPVSVYEHSASNQDKYSYSKIMGVGGDNALVIKFPYLRRSFDTNKKVSEILTENIEGTLWLALTAMLFATLLGIFLGITASLKPNTWLDHLIIGASVIGISVPSFVAATLVAMAFGYYLAEYTGLNLTGQLYEIDPFKGKTLQIKNLILPALTLGLRPLSIIVQLTRSSMLDVLSQDYIRTARAKGLVYSKVILKHALKNALNPVITAVSGWLASLLAGAFFIEYIFDWKGIGLVTLKAVETRDFPVVMGATIFIAFVFVIINIFVDILYAAIDPRVRLH
jgi:ABC-type dipeptide/oligopeptide/nickel transport system permease component